MKGSRGRHGWPRGQQNGNESVMLALGQPSICLTGHFHWLNCNVIWDSRHDVTPSRVTTRNNPPWSILQISSEHLPGGKHSPNFLLWVFLIGSEKPKKRRSPLTWGFLLHPSREHIPQHWRGQVRTVVCINNTCCSAPALTHNGAGTTACGPQALWPPQEGGQQGQVTQQYSELQSPTQQTELRAHSLTLTSSTVNPQNAWQLNSSSQRRAGWAVRLISGSSQEPKSSILTTTPPGNTAAQCQGLPTAAAPKPRR